MPYLTLRIVRLQLPADVNTAGDGANPAAITAGVRLNNTALEDCFETPNLGDVRCSGAGRWQTESRQPVSRPGAPVRAERQLGKAWSGKWAEDSDWLTKGTDTRGMITMTAHCARSSQISTMREWGGACNSHPPREVASYAQGDDDPTRHWGIPPNSSDSGL